MKTIFERYSQQNIMMVCVLISICTVVASIVLAVSGAPRWIGAAVICIAALNFLFVVCVGIFKLGKR